MRITAAVVCGYLQLLSVRENKNTVASLGRPVPSTIFGKVPCISGLFKGHIDSFAIFGYLSKTSKRKTEREICFIFNQINALTHIDQYC